MSDQSPTEIPVEHSDIGTLWDCPLQPAHCPQCGVAHLIPADLQAARCPACFEGLLEPQPTVLRPEPPELVVEYAVTPAQVKARLTEWLKGVWLRPKELNPETLMQRLTRTYIPMWLVDGQVSGIWQAQMGYDYQVASSQEVYRGGGWTTRKRTETRIRWEPRAGTIEQTYDNLSIPALEEHTTLMRGLGKFNLEMASSYSADRLAHTSIRVPSLLPGAAWPLARSGFDRLAAKDCQTAAAAQHVDEFGIEADYQELHWTQLLLPVYSSAYRDEQGIIYPLLIHGQNGKIFGMKRASQSLARNWSLGLVGLAIVCFVLGLLSAAGTALLPALGLISLLFFGGALLTGITAPIPAFWAWNFNRRQEDV